MELLSKHQLYVMLTQQRSKIKTDTLVTRVSGYQGSQDLHAKTELPKKKSKHKSLSKSDKKSKLFIVCKARV